MSDLPKSVWQGTFTLFGVVMRCHVLDDGQRIIEADDMAKMFEAMAGPSTLDSQEIARFSKWSAGR